MKYFKEGILKCFKISVKFLNISKWNISSCIPTDNTLYLWACDVVYILRVCYAVQFLCCLMFVLRCNCKLNAVRWALFAFFWQTSKYRENANFWNAETRRTVKK